ncbi:MAG: hypothetical protein H0T92_09370 [Pyrinomonadaceae bacterium]|nr:hypothetical protein [Pyrinomonadaceae bacterium]
MCEKLDEMSWVRVLSDAKPNAEENSRVSADTITPSEGLGTRAAVEGAADDQKQMRSQIEQTRTEVSKTIYTSHGKFTPERLTEQAHKEQAGDLMEHKKEELGEAIPETIKTAEDAVYKATTGKAGNVMQNVDKPINRVTEPTVGKVSETAGVAAQPIPAQPMPMPVQSMSAPPMPTAPTTSRETGSYVVDTVRQNPLPAALMGLGLSWLLMNMYQGRKRSVGYKTGRSVDEPMSSRESGPSQQPPIVLPTQSTVGDILGDAQEFASSVASRTQDQVSTLASRVQHGVRWVGHQYQQSLLENPLAAGAAALTLGSAIGLALPSTQAEDKLMGKAHEDLMRKVDEATHGTVQKVRDVAGEAGRAARREAEYQGLTG